MISSLPQARPSSAAGATPQTATRTYQLGSAAGVYDLPPLDGFSGSLSLAAANVPANTRLTLTSAFQAPAGAPSLQDSVRREQATGTLNVYFYTTMRLSSTVTFPTLPAFSVTLPATVNSTGLQFFYAISNPRPSNGAEVQFRTEGPATVSGQIVTFAPSTTPLTLLAVQRYTIAFYAISAIARPTPTPTPQPAYKSLYSFKGSPDGANPDASLIAVDGALYGTTYGGGASGNGTVFEVNTAGTERVLYSFKGVPDGQNPVAGLLAVNGALYGTTSNGGTGTGGINRGGSPQNPGAGTVFEVSRSGSERVLHSFQGDLTPDGSLPLAGLIAVDGLLYGTTHGVQNPGTVFEVSPLGKERVLYGLSLAVGPGAALLDVNGLLYGTTGGDEWSSGAIFEVSTSGAARLVHNFGGAPTDGAYPLSSLINVNGALYGTTEGGGTTGNGTVFELSTSGSERVLYNFKGPEEAARGPYGGLLAVNGVLYGTTTGGGTHGAGTVFAMSTSGTERVLYNFKGGTDGADPSGSLIAVSGALYGTTTLGGASGNGTVFEVALPQ